MWILLLIEVAVAMWGGTLLGAAVFRDWKTFGATTGFVVGLVSFYAIGDWLVGFNQVLLGQ